MTFGEDEIFKEYYEREIKNSNLENICSANNMIEAAEKCKNGVDWKESVQRYNINQLINVRASQKAIRDGSYKQKSLVEFPLSERGHTRDIKSHHISDRVVQKSLNDNVLMPRIQPYLIYNNGASIKNKGLDFTRTHFEIDMRESYSLLGSDCYVLLIDFSKYFDNIQHAKILEYLSQFLNPDEYAFVELCFKEFEVDVSYMTDEEYAVCMTTIFNSLLYAEIDKSLRTSEKIMKKSIGIGSQLSQITGVYYPHEIDNYCTIVRGNRFYGRYCDDTYLFGTKEQLLDILYNGIIPICNRLGIFINMKKTKIQNVEKEQITFLKINYHITENGGLVRKVHESTFHREHRRITKFYHLYKLGRMKLEDIILCYKSWRGTYERFDSGYEILKLDNYVRQTFNLDYYFNPMKPIVPITFT